MTQAPKFIIAETENNMFVLSGGGLNQTAEYPRELLDIALSKIGYTETVMRVNADGTVRNMKKAGWNDYFNSLMNY